MKIKTLIAAAAIAGMSTSAIAQNVTTPSGDVVMIEKNQASLGLLGLTGSLATTLLVVGAVVAVGAAAANSGS